MGTSHGTDGQMDRWKRPRSGDPLSPSGEGRVVLGAKREVPFGWFSFLTPTDTASSLVVEMVAAAAVGHVLLARVGALRVDARVPHGARGADA